GADVLRFRFSPGTAQRAELPLAIGGNPRVSRIYAVADPRQDRLDRSGSEARRQILHVHTQSCGKCALRGPMRCVCVERGIESVGTEKLSVWQNPRIEQTSGFQCGFDIRASIPFEFVSKITQLPKGRARERLTYRRITRRWRQRWFVPTFP